MSDKGAEVLKRADAAFGVQQEMMSQWEEAMSYCVPRKSYIFRGASNSRPWVPDAKLQNSVAAKAATTLASGMLAGFMNSSDIWAKFEPSDDLPPQNKTPRLEKWLENSTVVLMRTFGISGMYDRVYEALLDSMTGTAAIMVDGEMPGSDSPLNFTTWDVGSYAIAENCAGFVDRVWREMEYTVDQAMSHWKDYRPRRWEKMSAAQRMTQKECFMLEIMPRDEFEVGMTPGPMGMPYKGVIVAKNDKEVVWESGWPEFPVLVYRFQRQSGSNPWGTGPGIAALPDCRGTNFLDTAMADGYGKMVDPPLVVREAGMRGLLDATMGGVSAVENMADMPQRLFDVGQGINYAQQYLDRKKIELESHFFKDLFTPLLNDPRTLKAAQVDAMQRDLINVYAPFGWRFLGFVSQLLERSFMILLRQGLFGKIPPEAIVSDGKGRFLYPKIVHQSRMALEIQNLGQQKLRQLLLDITPLAAVDNTVLDWINMPEAIKMFGGNSPVMPNILRSPDEWAAIQQAKAQAAQQAQMQEFMAKFAEKNPDHAAALMGAGQSAAA